MSSSEGCGAARIYRALLFLFPPSFRREARCELTDVFLARHRAACRGAPWSRRAGFWGRTVRDVTLNAAAEWLQVVRPDLPFESPKPRDRFMSKVFQDARRSVRGLLRAPGFAAVAILSLALGIGANTTIYTLISAVFMNPLPVSEVDGLVSIFTRDGSNPNVSYLPVAVANTNDVREQNTVFESLVTVAPAGFTTQVGTGDPEQIGGAMVSAGYFSTLGVDPHLGRGFSADEDRLEAGAQMAVVSHAVWTRVFGGSPDALGASITLNGQPFTVIGVAPPGFKGHASLGSPEQIWVPFNTWPTLLPPNFHIFYRDRRAIAVQPIGRLAPGVTLEQAQSEMTALAARLEADYPDANRNRTLTLVPLAEAAVGMNVRDTLTRAGGVLGVVVGLVLLIACANLANLLLAKAATRERELSLRSALGASRGEILRQLLTESTVLAALGGAAGIGVAVVGVRVLWSFRPQFIAAGAVEPTVDGGVLAFTAVVTLLTGLLFGVLPAFRASRVDLQTALKTGGRSDGSGLQRSKLRSGLVVAEVALAVVGLIGAGLFIRSMQMAQRVDPGFDTEGLFVMTVALSGEYDAEEAALYRRQAVEDALAVPGVVGAAVSSTIPLNGPQPRTLIPEGATQDDQRSTMAGTVPVTAEYFDLMGIPLLRGRLLSDLDRADTEAVAVVNEEAARRFWPAEDVIGKRFSFYGDTTVRQVVGVVPNTSLSSLGGPAETAVYLPMDQWTQSFVVLHGRGSGDPSAAIPAVRASLQALDPTLSVQNVNTIDDLTSAVLWPRRVAASLLSIFAGLSLALAAVGIYGVMSYVSAQRKHEIGIRMALGAEQSSVLGMVLRQGLRLAVVGVLVGGMGAFAASRAVTGMLYGVSATDPVTYVGVPVLLVAVALVATGLPAWRATRVSPVRALRAE